MSAALAGIFSLIKYVEQTENRFYTAIEIRQASLDFYAPDAQTKICGVIYADLALVVGLKKTYLTIDRKASGWRRYLRALIGRGNCFRGG